MEEKIYYSTSEIASILGISRIAVFNKIKSGQIRAIKIGRTYGIPKNEVTNILGNSLTKTQKKVIDEGVRKTVKEYGEVLEKLGKE